MIIEPKSKIQSGSNTEHALLSPSSAKKWLACPASLACEFGIPNESGAAAVNGTAMHTLSEVHINLMLRDMEVQWPISRESDAWVLNAGKGPITRLKKEAAADKTAVKVTDDFISQVGKYLDYVKPIIQAAEVVEVEMRVNLTRVLHKGAEINGKKLETFGTADMVALLKGMDGSYTLVVVDLKTGRHKVLAKENKQMMIYALGLLSYFRKRGYDISNILLAIFQPYAGGADEWDLTPGALELFGKFAQTAAAKAIDAFERGKKGLNPADFRPGNDACQWCRFAEKCNAKRKLAVKDLSDDTDADSGGTEMTLEQLKAEWDKLPLMRQHISDIEKAMYAALMRGDKVDGLKLVEGRPGNKSWSDVEAAEKAFVEAGFDKFFMMKEVAMSPTEAGKTLTKEQMSVLEPFVTRKPGQPSIATADDKRPAWVPVSKSDLED